MITDYKAAVIKAFWHKGRKEWVDLTIEDIANRTKQDGAEYAAQLVAMSLAKHRMHIAHRGEEIPIYSVSDLGKRIAGLGEVMPVAKRKEGGV